MKSLLYTAIACIALSSCALHSTTYIDPAKTFVLGDNKHGAMKVKVENKSEQMVSVSIHPSAGGMHSTQPLSPGEHKTIRVDPNSAVHFENKGADKATIGLKVTGDLGLSMEYK